MPVKSGILFLEQDALSSNHSMVDVEGSTASHEPVVPYLPTPDVHTGPYGCIGSGDWVEKNEYVDDGIVAWLSWLYWSGNGHGYRGSTAIKSQIQKRVLIPTYKNIGGKYPDQILVRQITKW